MKLGASFAVCLPASAILLPSLTANVKSRVTTAIGVISRDRLLTSSELRASVSASRILDDPISVRESLINSEDFQALVERLEILSSSMDDDTCTEELPGDGNPVETSTCRHSESGMTATSANTAPSRVGKKEEEEIVRKSWVTRNRWERNADKLESLRMTVLESRKARSIAAAVRAVKDSSRAALAPAAYMQHHRRILLLSRQTRKRPSKRFRRYSPTMGWGVHGVLMGQRRTSVTASGGESGESATLPQG